MPRAGWCRECDEWVWLSEDGGCQNGHDADCIENAYEAQPEQRPRGVGEGDMPASFNRFNWGAFLLPAFWGLAYGSWSLVGLWMLALLTPSILALLLGGGEAQLAENTVSIVVISEFVAGAMRLYIGSVANGVFWRRENLRLKVIEGSTPRLSIDRFLGGQRTWTIVGAVVMALSFASALFVAMAGGDTAAELRSQLGITQVDAIASIVWLVAEVLLGWWLSGKMREDSLSPQDGAGTAA